MFRDSSRVADRRARPVGVSEEETLVKQLVKQVRLNNLQFNANRDPQVYRRAVNEPFRIQAMVDGNGAAKVTLTGADGKVLTSATVDAPGTFAHELSYPTAGTRVVALEVSRGSESYRQDLRLDVLDHAWIG